MKHLLRMITALLIAAVFILPASAIAQLDGSEPDWDGDPGIRPAMIAIDGADADSDFVLCIGEPTDELPDGDQDAAIGLIASSIADIADHEGYAFLGELGNLLLKKQPDFDPRNYGFLKLTPLIKSIPRFEIDVRQTRDPNIKHIYVRDTEA